MVQLTHERGNGTDNYDISYFNVDAIGFEVEVVIYENGSGNPGVPVDSNFMFTVTRLPN
jgi:hypothetical protein